MIVVGKDHIVGPWVVERGGGTWEGCGTTIGIERNGVLVGGVIFDNYNGANICIHSASDGTGRWMNREFLWFVFYYPFVQLGVKRITGPIPSSNFKARKFNENLGFELETTLKDAHPEGDLLIYKMTPDKCKWLNLKR